MVLRALRGDRPDDAQRRRCTGPRPRCSLPGRGRVSRSPGSRLPLGPPHPAPPRTRSVRQRATRSGFFVGVQSPLAGTERRTTSTSSSCARTSRVSTPRSVAVSITGPERERPRCRRPCLHVDMGSIASWTSPSELAQGRERSSRDLRHQVQRDRPYHAVLGTSASRSPLQPLPAPSRRRSSTSTSSRPISSCIRTGSTSWWLRISSATSSRTWGPAVAGSIGIAPAANINPERTFPSMFEPVHGSAPDIAGSGRRQSLSARSGARR